MYDKKVKKKIVKKKNR